MTSHLVSVATETAFLLALSCQDIYRKVNICVRLYRTTDPSIVVVLLMVKQTYYAKVIKALLLIIWLIQGVSVFCHTRNCDVTWTLENFRFFVARLPSNEEFGKTVIWCFQTQVYTWSNVLTWEDDLIKEQIWSLLTIWFFKGFLFINMTYIWQ